MTMLIICLLAVSLTRAFNYRSPIRRCYYFVYSFRRILRPRQFTFCFEKDCEARKKSYCENNTTPSVALEISYNYCGRVSLEHESFTKINNKFSESSFLTIFLLFLSSTKNLFFSLSLFLSFRYTFSRRFYSVY
jgi:hypothetical protein